ncbi:MAG: penicillin acylase family protein, partial [Deltaproteobacteria bacterium]
MLRALAIAIVIPALVACEPPLPIESLPVASTVVGCSHDGSTNVVVDRFGWSHVYAESLRDAACAQGYQAARERMVQMELWRRMANGSLAELLGSLSPALMDGDIAIRAIGLRRRAEAMNNHATSPRSRALLDGFSEGANLYIAGLRSGREVPPRGTELVIGQGPADWTPVDSLTILFLEAYSVGTQFEISTEISFTRNRQHSQAIFDRADMTISPELRARGGFDSDVYISIPSADAPTLPNFYGVTGQHDRIGSSARRPLFSEAGLGAMGRFADALPHMGPARPDSPRGSNAWTIAASRSATGHAVLAADPHLDFMSPSIFWGTHIVVRRGPDSVDAAGVTLPGLPGVLFGFNRHVAWGVTVGYLDTVDCYQETVTRGSNGAPDTVLFQNAQVPLESRVEHIPNGYGSFNDVTLQTVPHHGPIIPDIQNGRVVPATDGHEVSMRWAGADSVADWDRLSSMMYQRSATELQQVALQLQSMSLNWVAADTSGVGSYAVSGELPLRAAGAFGWDPVTNPGGPAPSMILPGTGEAEWIGTLSPTRLPQATTADHGFIASANNDPAGVLSDGNPFNDPVYLSWAFADGIRSQRIHQVLDSYSAPITLAQSQALQLDHRIVILGRLRPFLDRAFARLEHEWSAAGSEPDLATAATALRPTAEALRSAMRALDAWSLDAPSGVEAGATDAMRADSVGASIGHQFLIDLTNAALADEIGLIVGAGPTFTTVRRYDDALLHLLEHPEMLLTLDPLTQQSTIWDDLRTTSQRETRDAILVTGLSIAIQHLTESFHSPDLTAWLWGNLHTATFASLVPGPGAVLTIPAADDSMFPNGFP